MQTITELSEIVKDYLNGTTLKSLAEKYNTTVFKIKKILQANSITLRKRGELNRISGTHSLDLEYFKDINSHEKAYWLGYLMGDGNISKDGYKTSLISKDNEVILNFKKAIKSSHTLSHNKVYDKRTLKVCENYTIQVTSKYFTSFLISHGINSDKSYLGEFPKISNIYQSSFIRGLFDADGSICFLKKGQRKINFIATESIISKMEEIFNTVFSFSVITKSLVAEKCGHKILKMHINRFDDQNNFLNYIYSSSTPETRLSRKYELSLLPFFKKKTGPKKGWKQIM